MSAPLLAARDLTVDYPTARGRLRAVDGVSFELRAGEALGVVGESGSGKTSLARALVRLLVPAAGRVEWLGRDLASLGRAELRAVRRDLQFVFQDPVASLDPRMTIGESVAEPLQVHQADLGRDAVRERVDALLARVGLAGGLAERFPHELSGGQCQRAAIARAMITSPRVLVCDEAVSALDVSVQAQILDLLADLSRERGLALVFVSHDLAVVRRLCTRVLVMYLGRTMELGAAATLYRAPRHPYTRLLLESVAVADPALERARPPLAAGEPASPFAPPSGCVFRTRCGHASADCASRVPALEASGADASVACLRWRELPAYAR